MLGYLYAMSEGAQVIADIDDDNIPKDGWTCPEFEGEFDVIAGCGFVNVYRHFTDAFVWPRGYPLRLLRAEEAVTPAHRQSVEIGVWQFPCGCGSRRRRGVSPPVRPSDHVRRAPAAGPRLWRRVPLQLSEHGLRERCVPAPVPTGVRDVPLHGYPARSRRAAGSLGTRAPARIWIRDGTPGAESA
jgi:hypothetical protein